MGGEKESILQTERLVLRPWLQLDAPALYDLARDPAIGPIAGWPPHESVEDSANVITTILSVPDTYAVVLKSTGELVGCAGFNSGDAASMPLEADERELGYWIGKPHWGCGYATEAARAVLDHGFNDLKLSGVHACYRDDNDRSRHVLEKLGFTYVRTDPALLCKALGERRACHLVYLAAQGWLNSAV